MRLFELLIRLYPACYRAEFGAEMAEVVAQATRDARRRGVFGWLASVVKESSGLAADVLRERLRYSLGSYRWFQVAERRFAMRSEFKYPMATVPMMMLIFAGIMAIIYKARAVALSGEMAKYQIESSYSVGLTFAIAFLVAFAAGLVGWLILHSLHQSGVHRLSEAQTWPSAK